MSSSRSQSSADVNMDSPYDAFIMDDSASPADGKPSIGGDTQESKYRFSQISLPPPPPPSIARPHTEHEKEMVKTLEKLKFFLATAPSHWDDAGTSLPQAPFLHRFHLPNGEHVSCVMWNGLYHITGTDIVRALVFRFESFGRPVRNLKKFEEGIFADLRSLKPGDDASLEEPKSPFLDLLFKNSCIRSLKKQKVFYWYSVSHDRLFLAALERDLKREKMGIEPTSAVVGEPARSFQYDPRRSLVEQFCNPGGGYEDEDLERAVAAAVKQAERSDQQHPVHRDERFDPAHRPPPLSNEYSSRFNGEHAQRERLASR